MTSYTLNKFKAEIEQLKTQRDELLETLIFARRMMVANDLLPSNMPNTFEKIDDAIAKAKGEA